MSAHGYLPISSYGAIGDGRSVALVGRDGSVDWLCWPRIDSPSLFGAVLDPARGGCWRIAPAGPVAAAAQRYLDRTNVLETRFRTLGGTLAVTDCMPAASESQKRLRLTPECELLRVIECIEGSVEVEMHCDPRPEYGRRALPLRPAGALGWRAAFGPHLLTLRSDLPLRSGTGSVTARCRLSRGETRYASLTLASEGPAVLPPLGELSRNAVARSVDWWQRWTRRITYNGPFREQVIRSALALKLLVFAPSGAVSAAPTMSLPERIGGALNWDYRYCWLRDASLTARAWMGLGCVEEAEAFASWLLHATRLTHPRLGVLYTVYGRPGPRERRLPHLDGYRQSRPVRAGNAAMRQHQLDVYGEVIDAVAQLAAVRALDRETQHTLLGLGRYVCTHWWQPDAGIWESRRRPVLRTHSLAMAWTALTRLLELHRIGALRGLPVAQYERHRQRIRDVIETRGWNARLNSYVSELDGDAPDASLLLLAWHGLTPPGGPRMRQTFDAIRASLQAGPGLFFRNTEQAEGAFGVCSGWAVEYLARGGGRLEEAERMFRDFLDYANALGLFAEEVDPATGEALGNFPLAFTHVGVINAALAIADRRRRDEAADRRRTALSAAP